MPYVDLHVHSNASDGTFTPAQVVEAALAAGLSAMALTDHDTVAGVPEAIEASRGTSLELIPGTELSCVYQGTEIHILGLYINWQDPLLCESLEQVQQIREKRNTEMLRRFQEAGFPITTEELNAGNPDTVITRAHFAKVLTQKGYARDMTTAFRKYLQYGGPYCIRKEEMTPERAMELLTHAGAVPVLAHPMQYKFGYQQVEDLLTYLMGMGLQGVEVYHPSSNQCQSGKLLNLANRLQLFPTGGSDFHGLNKPDIHIGTGRGNLRVPEELLNRLKQR